MLRTLPNGCPGKDGFWACFDGFTPTWPVRSCREPTLQSDTTRSWLIYGRREASAQKQTQVPNPSAAPAAAPQQWPKQNLPWKNESSRSSAGVGKKKKKTAVGLCQAGDWYLVVPRPVLLVISRDRRAKREDDLFLHDRPGEETRRGRRPFMRRWCFEDTSKIPSNAGRPAVLQTWNGRGPNARRP